MRIRNVAALLVATLGTTALAPSIARAGDGAIVDVEIRAEARVASTLLDEGQRVVGACVGPCTLRLPRGRYEVRVDGPGMPSASETFAAEGRRSVTVKPGSVATQWTGGAVAIAGGLAVLIGLVGLADASRQCAFDRCHDEPPEALTRGREEAQMFGIVAGLGAVSSLVGIMLLSDGRTAIDVRAAQGPQVGFAVAPTRGGAVAGLGFTF